jgi:hypothetical protein
LLLSTGHSTTGLDAVVDVNDNEVKMVNTTSSNNKAIVTEVLGVAGANCTQLRGVAPGDANLGSGIVMSASFAGADLRYDEWLDVLTAATGRLDDLQTIVTEVRYLCENGCADSEQILRVLEQHGV